MVLQVNLLIYAYMALCACMIVFNIIYVGRRRWHLRRSPARVQKYREWMTRRLTDPAGSLLTGKPQKEYKSILRRCSRLLLFEEALEQMGQELKVRERIRSWIWMNRELLLGVSDGYLKKKGMQRAFYAYFVETWRLCATPPHDPFVEQMQRLVLDHSMYCRENALCALYASGVTKHVVRAYTNLTRLGMEHSAKMVTDGLLEFNGDKESLAEALWSSWDTFSDYYRAAFVNFIRMVSGSFRRRFLPILTDTANDREVRFAVLRYYRKYFYRHALEPLCTFVSAWQQEDWEYAALAALALEAYAHDRSVAALQEGCRSRNWHVRYNSAQSLAKLIPMEALQRLAESETDAYARDMLLYIISRNEVGPDDGCH